MPALARSEVPARGELQLNAVTEQWVAITSESTNGWVGKAPPRDSPSGFMVPCELTALSSEVSEEGDGICWPDDRVRQSWSAISWWSSVWM